MSSNSVQWELELFQGYEQAYITKLFTTLQKRQKKLSWKPRKLSAFVFNLRPPLLLLPRRQEFDQLDARGYCTSQYKYHLLKRGPKTANILWAYSKNESKIDRRCGKNSHYAEATPRKEISKRKYSCRKRSQAWTMRGRNRVPYERIAHAYSYFTFPPT